MPWKCCGVPPNEILRRTWEEIRADDVFGRSAQLAYYFFLALFPFLISVISTLSIFGLADRGRAFLFALLARFLPGMAFELIVKTFNEIIASSGPLKMSLGILASLWSASLGMSATMDTLNATYKVKETRSILRQYLTAFSLTMATGALVVVSTSALIIGDDVVQILKAPRVVGFAWYIVKWPVTLGLLLFLFASIYYFAPDLKIKQWHWITPGALAGVTLLLAVSGALKLYLRFAGSYTSTYGSLGGVIVLLLFFYLGGIAVLAGGALNGVLERHGS
jgi:membrane protein